MKSVNPALDAFARREGDGFVLSVRVQPRASQDAITGVKDGSLLVRTTAPPADGKANKGVIRLLADHLRVAPSRLVLLRGPTGRDKQFLLRGP